MKKKGVRERFVFTTQTTLKMFTGVTKVQKKQLKKKKFYTVKAEITTDFLEN